MTTPIKRDRSPKQKITISIDPDLLKQVEARVDGIFIRSRSDAIEKSLLEYFSRMKRAVILAGGEPERIYINELSKYAPLCLINEKTLVEDTLIKCKRAGFDDIIIIGFRDINTQLFNVLGDGDQLGVNIKYVEEMKPLGVAKTLEVARDFLKTDFLMIPGDCFLNFDLNKLHEFHLMHSGIATLAIYSRRDFDYDFHPELWRGIVELSGANIVFYEEKPEKAKTHLLSTLIGFISPEIFNYIPDGSTPCSLQEEIFPQLAEEHRLYGFIFVGDWVNIHTKEDVELVKKLSRVNHTSKLTGHETSTQ